LGGLAGCNDDGDGGGGSGSSMPTNASKEEFCGNFDALAEDIGKLDPTDSDGALRAARDAVEKMRTTGTPDGIPDDARHGLEVTLDAIDSLADDATVEDLA